MKHTLITLKPKEHHRVVGGHQWIFSNEIQKIEGETAMGDIATVLRNDGMLLGKGFYNPHSLIAVRLISRKDEPVDFDFFKSRIESSLKHRTHMFPDSKTFRVVNGESDFLPGLIIDQYGPVVVVQIVSAGMERLKTLIYDVIESLIKPSAIIEKNETHLRELEHLPLETGVVRGTMPNPPLHVTMNDLTYSIDILNGQKTGWFLDQRMNHHMTRSYAHKLDVLDCYCYDGGFSLNAAAAGARSVTAVDSSDAAVQRATENARLNKLEDRVQFISADAEKTLVSFAQHQQRFGLIIVDPPSFTRSKKNVGPALHAYRALHDNVFKILTSPGYLITACCSYHISEDAFFHTITHAAHRNNRSLQLLERRGASYDHPISPYMPETMYLKLFVFRVL
jgi:23S rRNA (cytosine1962-C5)-methyltransferase